MSGRQGGKRSALRPLGAGMLLALLIGAGSAPPAAATEGTLTVTADTTLAEDHHGDVVIGADGVTLDCAGYRIVGSGHQAGVFVQYRTGVTIRHCHTLGFLKGILVDQSSRVVLERNQSSENEYGFEVSGSDQVRVEGNKAAGNIVGFNVFTVTGTWLSQNRAVGNEAHGFVLTDTNGNVLSSNVAEDNGQIGFLISESRDNAFESNIALRNETGFLVKDSSGNHLTSNFSSENRTDGFQMVRVVLGQLSRNRAIGNARDGFRFEQSGDIQFSENMSEDNGEYEIAAEESMHLDVRGIVAVDTAGGSGGFILQPRYVLELLSFLGLAGTIWLGLYLVGQPRRTSIAWLTALTLWSAGGIFLDDFMDYNQPAKGFVLQIQETLGFWPGANQIVSQVVVLGWISKFAIVFWLHATTLMRPGGMTRGRKALVVVGYALAAAFAVISIVSPVSMSPTGVLYPAAVALLVIFAAVCLVNLVEALRGARSEIERRQFVLLVAATLLAGLSGLVFVGVEWLGRQPLSASGTALFLLAVVLLGYGVANYSAIVEGRTIRRHFIYSLAAVGMITLLYFVVSYLSSVSFGVRTAAFAFVILLAVVTHSLVGNARAILDYFFVDPETRKVLRAFRLMPNNLSRAGRLEERLGLALDSLCTEVRASYGLVFLVSGQTVRLAASYHWRASADLPLRAEELSPDDIQAFEPGSFPRPLDGAALLAPLYLDTEHVGAVLLGHPVNGTRYTQAEVDLTGYASDRMAEIMRFKRLEDEALAHITEVAVVLPTALAEGEPSIASVEGALRRIHDLPYLGGSPLAQLRVVRARFPDATPTSVDQGRAVHQVLVEAIDKLKPEGQRPAHSSPREWHHYMVLHEAYLMDRANREVMADLYISEGTFNRRRREAIEAVTRFLREQEEGGAGPSLR